MKSTKLLVAIGLIAIAVLFFVLINLPLIQFSDGPEQPGQVSAPDSKDISSDAMEILSAKCASCHGPDSGMVGGFNNITDRDGLVDQQQLFPGNSEASRIFQSLNGSHGLKLMPPSEPLTPAEISIIGDWINQGARLRTARDDN